MKHKKKKPIKRNPIVGAMIRNTKAKIEKAQRGKGSYNRKKEKKID